MGRGRAGVRRGWVAVEVGGVGRLGAGERGGGWEGGMGGGAGGRAVAGGVVAAVGGARRRRGEGEVGGPRGVALERWRGCGG